MRKVFLLIFLSIISCKEEDKIISKPIIPEIVKEKSVVEILSQLNKKDTIHYLDLSNKGIDSLPDLSFYNIVSLDLSFNNLDTIPLSRLPLTLKKLKCTNNHISKFIATNYKNSNLTILIPYHTTEINFEEIDLSFNKLNVVTIITSCNNKAERDNVVLRKVVVSNNNLKHLGLNDNLEYLDVSNNLSLPSEVLFEVDKIDTLLQNNNPNKLKTKRIPPPPPIICNF